MVNSVQTGRDQRACKTFDKLFYFVIIIITITIIFKKLFTPGSKDPGG